MIKKEFLYLTVFFLALAILVACEKTYGPDSSGDDDDHDGNSGVLEESGDYLCDSTGAIRITLNGSTITADPAGPEINGGKVTITAAGTYIVSGSLTDGQIIIDTKDEGNIWLVLNGANIKCLSSAPVYIRDARKVIILLNKNTNNYLTDGTSYVTKDGEPNAALFSNAYFSIYGEGSLNVTANYNDGISGDDGLVIKNGTISVTAADDGIRGKDFLIIRDGNITVKSVGDGLKSDNEEDTDLGYIIIDYGVFKITANSGDGIAATTDLELKDGIFDITTGTGASNASESAVTTNPGGPVPGGGGTGGYSGTISEKALKAAVSLTVAKGTFILNSADDALHSNKDVSISDGTFTIASGDDAVHAETSFTIDGGTLNVSKCYEGIESALITINGGNVSIVSTDDSFNATKGKATESNDGSSLTINDGNICVNTSNGDGLDSNGNLTVNGGRIVIHGPQSQPEVGFDVNGTFSISGGIFIATGPNSGNMIEVPSLSSAQYSIKVTTSSGISSSTLFNIQDASGKSIATFKPVRSLYYIVFSSPDLKSGSSYSIYTGGTSTGSNANGLYTDGIYTGGTLRKSFNITSKVTSISF